MKVNIVGHSFDITPPLKTHTEEKLQRLHRHHDRIINIDIHFSIEKLKQTAKGTIFVKGTKLHAEASANDMYSSIDSLVDMLDKQLKRYKEKMTNHHPNHTRETIADLGEEE